MTTLLHAAFESADLARFKALLQSGRFVNGVGTGAGVGASVNAGAGGSLSKSPNSLGPKYSKSQGKHAAGTLAELGFSISDINKRDRLGRTILHSIASDPSGDSIRFLTVLLEYAGHLINPNLQDLESGYTALHRALYAGNIVVAHHLIRERTDLDLSVKDFEGLTPFDLYNGTVEGTNPGRWEEQKGQGASEIFVWGNNRNYVLGLPNADERAFPEKLAIKRTGETRGLDPEEKFRPSQIRDVAMGRLHTVIATDDASANARACGFGSGGRLGFVASTQFSFLPIPSLSAVDVAHVAVAQDHTVVVSAAGDVYTFGLNRYCQLGYPIEDGPTVKEGDAIQTTPKRVIAGIKREVIIGCAASRCASVAWTNSDLFTWGTNHGQLGYDLNATPVQTTPRKVPLASGAVLSVAISEFAMTIVLKQSHDVLYFIGNTYFRLNFPFTHAMGQMARARRSHIIKVACGGSTAMSMFAALSNQGDVYVWSAPDAMPSGEVKPPKLQRVWALRKKFTAVTDVAVGLDGSIILCTESGHVFVRTRRIESARNVIGTSSAAANRLYKYVRIPYLQRVVRVFANETGGFAALKMGSELSPIAVVGRSLGQDFRASLGNLGAKAQSPALLVNGNEVHLAPEHGDEEEALGFSSDLSQASALIVLAEDWQDPLEAPNDARVLLVSREGRQIAAEKCILSARSPTLLDILAGKGNSTAYLRYDPKTGKLHFTKTSTLALLILLDYLYSDNLVRIWVPMIAAELREAFMLPKWVKPESLYIEMKFLAMDLALPWLAKSLESTYALPIHLSLSDDMSAILESMQAQRAPSAQDITGPTYHSDALLLLQDCVIPVHVFVLTSRCPFFAAMYGNEGEWVSSRRSDAQGLVMIDMEHVRAEVMDFVLEHIYCDTGVDAFRRIDKESEDEFNEFVLEVLAAANELLLDKLKLICQAVLRRHVHLGNVSAMLHDASMLEAVPLKQACLSFCTANLETMLEGHLLDNLSDELLAALAEHTLERQNARHPYTRGGSWIKAALQRHRDYLRDPDIAIPSDAFLKRWRDLPPRSPSIRPLAGAGRRRNGIGNGRTPLETSPGPSPDLRALPDSDLMFSFDDEVVLPASSPRAANGHEETAEADEGGAGPGSSSLARLTAVTGANWARQASTDPSRPSAPNLRDILATEVAVKGRRVPSRTEATGTSEIADGLDISNVSLKLSQRDRKRLQQSSTSVGKTSSETSIPWRDTAAPLPPGTPISPWASVSKVVPPPDASSVQDTAQAKMLHPKTPLQTRSVSATVSSSSPRTLSPAAILPKLESASPRASPIITPARQSKEKSSSRRGSESPWTWANFSTPTSGLTGVGSPETPVRSGAGQYAQHSGSFSLGKTVGLAERHMSAASDEASPARQGSDNQLSFAAIQAQQQYQGDLVRGKIGRKTLSEIQAEETLRLAAEKESQQAEDFARWWDAAAREVQSESVGTRGRGSSRGRGGGSRSYRGKTRVS